MTGQRRQWHVKPQGPDTGIRIGKKRLVDSRMRPGPFALDPVHQPEKGIPRLTPLHRRPVLDTLHFDGVIKDAAFDILVRDAAYLDRPADPFEGRGDVKIRKTRSGNFDRDQLIFIVLLPVQAGLETLRGVIFHDTVKYPETKPVKKQYTQQQYGSKLSQYGTN